MQFGTNAELNSFLHLRGQIHTKLCQSILANTVGSKKKHM